MEEAPLLGPRNRGCVVYGYIRANLVRGGPVALGVGCRHQFPIGAQGPHVPPVDTGCQLRQLFCGAPPQQGMLTRSITLFHRSSETAQRVSGSLICNDRRAPPNLAGAI